MKIFIQARKDGYNVLYPKPTPQEFFNFGSDIQRIDAQTQPCCYGKGFYSLAFSSSGCILSKYLIGYDVPRGAIGYIAFSVFIPQDKTLSGQDVKALLDDLVRTYIQNYSPNFYFDNKRNEDWNLFADIADGFDSHLKQLSDEDVESVASSSETPAFVFYRTEEELSSYLNNPYQSEYYPYQQVYFVDKKYEGQKDSPLSIVKINPQANLTGRIDLDNPKFRIEFESSLTQNVNRIRVEVNNGAYWRQIFNKNKIRRKDVIRVSWSKECYEPKTLTGTLDELSDTNCININTDNKTVYINDIDLKPVKKSIKITVNDPNGQSIPKPSIACYNSDNERRIVDNGIITFVGKDTRCEWTISAKFGKMSGLARIIPINSPDCFPVTVHEKVSIEVSVIDADTKEPVNGFEIWTKHSGGFSKVRNIDFIDNEIDQEAHISVRCKGYIQGDFEFKPRSYISYSKVIFGLSKKAGPGGEIAFWIKKHFMVITSICIAIILGILALFILQHHNTDETSTKYYLWPTERVEAYLKGDSLILNHLETCLKSLEESKPKSKSRFPFFWSKGKENDNWLEHHNKISNEASNIHYLRKCIDNNDWIGFADCDDSLFYNSHLKDLKHIVNKVDKNIRGQIDIPDVNNLPLINIRENVERKIDSLTKKNETSNTYGTGDNNQIVNPDQMAKKQSSNASGDNGLSEEEKNSIAFLQNGDWTKTKLERYKGKISNQKIKQEIELALKLWELNGKEGNSYYSYKQAIYKTTYLRHNSILLDLLEEQKQKEHPKCIKDIPGNLIKPLSELKAKAYENN